MSSDRRDQRVRVLFLGNTFVGHAARLRQLEKTARNDPRIDATFRYQTGWKVGGWIERLPILSTSTKGRLRSTVECAPLATLPRPDVIWTSASLGQIPFLWSQLGGLRRPLVRDLDWTVEQQEAFAPIYFKRQPRRGISLAAHLAQERLFARFVTLFTPWSNWAAASLRRQRIAAHRIRVLPPGVDLELWRPRPELRGERSGPMRILFVGGDFDRKGGHILLDVFRQYLVGRCEIDIVTRDAVDPVPGVRVHRAEIGSQVLRDLYARAELFVLPSRAECFGIAAIEAMASGLPVIMSDEGGAHDIVEDGTNGWLIKPTAGALLTAMEHALTVRESLPAYGQAGRHIAERKFDGTCNDMALLDILVALASDTCVEGTGKKQ